jgi:FG-GAP-like repeat
MANPGPSWHARTTGDFNGDGTVDILWQNDDGAPAVWLMNGTTFIGGGGLANPGPTWHARMTGDFNGDGKADIVWQNDDGAPAIWLMNGTSFIGGGGLANPGPSWHIAGTGDFNGDGKADILWQNDDGTPAIWLMDGTSFIGGGGLGNPGPSWRIAGTGDFNSDGKADILWQNNDGTPAIWLMNGTSFIGGGGLANPGLSWHVAETGDFNGDAKSDILWQNNDGTPAIWLMDGTSFIGGGGLGNPGLSWHIAGTGDFNGDLKSDILWQNSDGTPAVWLMNGANFIGGGIAGDAPSLRFNVEVNDTIGTFGSLTQLIRTDVAYAGSVWASYIRSSATIDVRVNISETPSNTANGTSATSVFLNNAGGMNLFEIGTISEMLTGSDPNGVAPDVIINLDPDFINTWLYFDANPSPTSAVPLNKTDAVETFEHELGHAFGLNGFLDQATGASGASGRSTFDAFVTIVNGVPYFTGPRAEAIYGGPVPLTIGNIYHVGNSAGQPGSGLLNDLMNGVVGLLGKSPGPSSVDLAILEDVGVPMRAIGAPNVAQSYPEVAGAPPISAQSTVAATTALNLTSAPAKPNPDVGLSSVSDGLNSPSLTFIGSPITIPHGGVTAVANIALTHDQVELATKFAPGADELRIALNNVPPADLLAFDTAICGQHAVSRGDRSDLTHGVVRRDLPGSFTAGELTAHHLSFASNLAIVS